MISVCPNVIPFIYKSKDVVDFYFYGQKISFVLTAEKVQCITGKLEKEMEVERAKAGTGEY